MALIIKLAVLAAIIFLAWWLVKKFVLKRGG